MKIIYKQMKRVGILILLSVLTTVIIESCKHASEKKQDENIAIKMKVEEFAPVKLTSNLDVLSEKQKQMLPLLFEAADIMESIFWKEAYGDKAEVYETETDPSVKQFVAINYGPWERLNNMKPFVSGHGEKSLGANFYPGDMTTQEFEEWKEPNKGGLYSLVRRDTDGKLKLIPYHVAFKSSIEKAAGLIQEASELAEDEGLKRYLQLRSKALLTDEYYESDVAWMEMKNNTIDFVVGPIENYEDRLFGYRAAHEAFILLKDKEWSKKLERFAALLPQLQKDLPCPVKYKAEMPGLQSDLNVYDAIYYAGDCNAASKTIAINLPNDEKVRMNSGSRKLQLKNVMKAKFDKILIPISKVLIDESQRQYVSFDAFFENTMFHEVAHGLGPATIVDGDISVREALKNHATSIEEGKADILGLWAITRLNEMGELNDHSLMENYVTFMAGFFRSVRFGAASAHGKANMMRYNYFKEKGAFTRDQKSGTYTINFDKMKETMIDLSRLLLEIEGDGDYTAAAKMVVEQGVVPPVLQNDLDRISEAGIPKDIVFIQGPEVVGL